MTDEEKVEGEIPTGLSVKLLNMRTISYPFIIFSTRLTRFLGRAVSLGDSAMAITFWPFIIVRSNLKHATVLPELIRHETIHIRQQLELLLIGAWILYGLEYFYARHIKKLDKRQAYYHTAMEQEAHRNAMKPDYIKNRKPYAVLRYITDKKMLGRTATGELIEKDFA